MELNINESITKYCGSNWLEQLETITGNIRHIDEVKYNDAMDKINKCNSNIKILLKRYFKKTLYKELTEFKINFDEIYTEKYNKKQRKNLKRLNPGYLPENLIKTPWFNFIKKLESEIFHTIESIFMPIDVPIHFDKNNINRRNIYKDYNFEKYQELIKEHPDYVERCKFYDMSLNNEVFYDDILNIHKFASIIINILLTPMYDVKEKIVKSFDKRLTKVFKPEMMRKNNLTKEIVVNLLTDFMIAKYRATITSNDKYFMNMLINNLTEGTLSEMNGASFIEVMDTLNTDVLLKSKAGKFTEKAKDIIKKIVENPDKFDKNILEEVKELIEDKEDNEDKEIINEIITPDILKDMVKEE